MLNLDDFGKLKDINVLKSKSSEEDKTPKEIEKYYQEKILQLQREYEELVKKVEAEAFEKGYEKGLSVAKEEFEKRLLQESERIKSEYEKSLAEISNRYSDIKSALERKSEEYLHRLSEILLDNLSEMFEFLYIKECNIEEIKDAITKTIEEFKEALPMQIRVSKSLFEHVKGAFANIKVVLDENLKEGDFVIEFYEFKLENSIKEKLEVLKDEIKRETKKFT